MRKVIKTGPFTIDCDLGLQMDPLCLNLGNRRNLSLESDQ